MWKAEVSRLFPVCFNKRKSGTGSSIFFFFFGGGGGGVFNKIIIPIANVGYDCGEVAVRRDQWKCNWDRWKEGWTEKSTLGLSSQTIKK